MDQLRAVAPAPRRPARAARNAARSLLAALLLAVAACRVQPGGPANMLLEHTFDAPEAAASAVLEAVAAKDLDHLSALALSEREFRQVVWPELPSSRPEVNLPVDYAWRTLQQNSRANLAMTLRAHGGRQYTIARVDMGQSSSRHRTFAVYRDVALVVRDAAGVERRLRLFGSLLERDNRWKIFSYVVD